MTEYAHPRAPEGMTLYRAVAIAEGFGEGEHASRAEMIGAWQWLIDNGHVANLQGWYMRTAIDLINAGHCHLPECKNEKRPGGVDAPPGLRAAPSSPER